MPEMQNSALSSLHARTTALAAQGTVVAFHMKAWKHCFLEEFFPQKRFHFAPFQLTQRSFEKKMLPLLEAADKPQVFVWSNNLPAFAAQHITRLGLDVWHMEDGFIRSLEAQAGYSVPLSLTLDANRPYFDSRGKSDLEDLLASYDFDADEDLMQRAREGMRTVLQQRLTKYNGNLANSAHAPAQHATQRKQVLVIGQVEEDASILYGCDRPFTNNDLVRTAAAENPDADIIYKPHPDVLSRMRRELSNPDDVAHLCTIMREKASLPDALDAADHVYSITSLAGFEALMRGKKVTTIGAPFYAGWGLTDDRQASPRRGRKLSVEAVFAAAYLLYPIYYDPDNGRAVSFEATIASLVARRAKPRVSLSPRLKWKPYGTYGLLGWRHLLTPIIAPLVSRFGNERDTLQYRGNPAGFFRELSDERFRLLGRILYPW